MTEYAHFKHAITGRVEKFPVHYGRLFSDVLTEVDASEASCLDCGFKEPEPEFPQSNEDPEVTILPLAEPAPRRSRRKTSTDSDTVE